MPVKRGNVPGLGVKSIHHARMFDTHCVERLWWSLQLRRKTYDPKTRLIGKEQQLNRFSGERNRRFVDAEKQIRYYSRLWCKKYKWIALINLNRICIYLHGIWTNGREPMMGPLQLEIYPIDHMVNIMNTHRRLDFGCCNLIWLSSTDFFFFLNQQQKTVSRKIPSRLDE